MQKSLMMSSTILPVVDHWLLLLLKYGFYVSVQVLFAVWFIRRLIRKQTLESPARWGAMIFVIQVVSLFLFLVIPSLLALCGRFLFQKKHGRKLTSFHIFFRFSSSSLVFLHIFFFSVGSSDLRRCPLFGEPCSWRH